MKDQFQKAKNYAFLLLKYRIRSIEEMRQRLVKKNYDNDIIYSVIEFLKENEFLNDKYFARLWVKSRINQRPCGRKFLIYELKKKGIDPVIIEDAVSIIDEEAEYELAKKIAEKKFLILKKEYSKAKSKLYAYLLRRGFKTGLVLKITREFFNDEK